MVSRAKQQAGVLSSALREMGCSVIEIPFIEIRKPSSYQPLDAALRNFARYDWLILTSVNGVEALFERLAKKKIDTAALTHFKIAAIGPATRKAIEQHGLRVAMTPKEYVAESVVASLRRKVKGKRVLLVRAKDRSRCDSARIAQGRRRSRCGGSLRDGRAQVVGAAAARPVGQQNTKAARDHFHQLVYGEELRRAIGIAQRACRC